MDDDSTLLSRGDGPPPRAPARAPAGLDSSALADTNPQAPPGSLHASWAAARPIGSGIGRYIVLGELGRGGMGSVVRAYDPTLQREVAIKEVHRLGGLDDESMRRLAIEARAMAKLSHPHVVAIYDVEELPDGTVALVMEYVRGTTLRQWLLVPGRDWLTVVRCFVAAGRGLAAAHAAGLLHRDFKPANVLVADDGAVKVTDFGLAKGTASSKSSAIGIRATLGDDENLTVEGAVMGTPRYMPPEQLRGEPVTAAADQYAFCVALWEALCGEPPFPHHGGTVSKESGPPPWPRRVVVPEPIARAVVRGLAPRTIDRWPSMEALLDALAWDPAGRRTRRWLALGGTVVLASTMVAGRAWLEHRAARCTGAERQLDGIWDEARRERVEAAMLDVGAPYSASASERTRRELDDYAAGWAAMYTEACEATTLRGELSVEIMDLRMTCLRRSASELEAVTTQLATADRDVVQNAHRLTGSLRPLSRCADLDALQAAVEPPLPHEAEAVESIRRQVTTARLAEASGRFDEARAELEQATAALTLVEYLPVHTEVALAEGLVLERVGDYEASAAAYERALELATRSQQREELAEAATQLLFVVGSRQARATEVLRYVPLARGLVEGDARRQARLAFALGSIHHERAEHVEAEAQYRRNLELLEQALGPDHLQVAMARINVADALRELGRRDEAEAEHRRGIVRMEEILGPAHPATASARHNLALVLGEQGRHAEAEAELRRVLTQLEATFGPEHPNVAGARDNLGVALRNQGRLEQAEAEQRLALALRERAYGPVHPVVAGSHLNLGDTLSLRGKHEEAEAHHRRSLEMRQQVFGPDHPSVAESRVGLGRALAAQHRNAEAEAELRRALAVLEPAFGREHPQLVEVRAELEALLEPAGAPPTSPRGDETPSRLQ